jgi:ubiquinone/menaquinone biosynthesis C-methylase UbiE
MATSPQPDSPTGFDAIVRFYDAHHGRLQDDIPALLAYARRCGGPVLDLGVGTGRLALPLARSGYEVVGVDNSAAMLSRARRRLEAAGLADRVQLVRADFTSFQLDRTFALAWCGYNGFLHLHDQKEQLAALRCWRRHLQPGGVLVIDVENPQLERLAALDGSLELAGFWQDEETGHTVHAFYAGQVSLADQVQDLHLFYDEILADGTVRRTTARFALHILFRRELDLLLRLAGFSAVEWRGDYELTPWEPDSPRLLAAAMA